MADTPPDRDPEIRKRAAWLLGMLALVAALFVTLMVTFFNTSGGGGSDDQDNADATAPALTSPANSPSGTARPAPRTTDGSDDPSDGESPTSSSTSSPTSSPSGSGSGEVACPSDEPCALDSDVGNAVAAINAYRTSNGRQAVAGSVSDAAKKCALSNGSDCSGGWAESQVPLKGGRADGEAAVEKIKSLGKLLTDMKSVEVGWAYDPGKKQLYFAIVRQG